MWLAGGAIKLDSEYPSPAMIARIRQSSLGAIQWANTKPLGAPDGDGLLIVLKPGDPTSGIVAYLSSGRLVSGVPKNYEQISLE